MKRQLLASSILFATFALPSLAFAVGPKNVDDTPDDATEYRLRLFSQAHQEHIDVVYRIGDEYLPEAHEQLNHFLRDQHNGEEIDYDVREFDLLHDLMAELNRPDEEINVICAYRSAATNAMLRRRSRAVAKHSQHIEGKAMDIRIPGVTAKEVRDASLALQRGGVGYYSSAQFVHVDVGDVRKWSYSPSSRRHRRSNGKNYHHSSSAHSRHHHR